MNKKLMFFLICFLIIFFVFINSFAVVDTSNLYINSDKVILMDMSTGKVVYDKYGYDRAFPASTTKILSSIIILENCKLDDIATASYSAIMSVPQGYSHAELQVGETMFVKDLLYLMLVVSANDAANVLAEHVAGSINSFSTMMNSKATEIGCTNSHFINPSGIHHAEHYSSAYDLALITKYAMKNSTFRSIVSTVSYSIASTNMHNARTLKNTNALLLTENPYGNINYYYPYSTGVKTGYTGPAKECLVATAEKDGLSFICVILGSEKNADGVSYRYTDCTNLFDFGFKNYKSVKIRSSGEIITDVKNKYSKKLELVVQDDIILFLDKSVEDYNLNYEIKLDDDLKTPIMKNTVIGTISYNIDGVKYNSTLASNNTIAGSANIIILIISIILIILFSRNFQTRRKKTKKGNYRLR